MNSLKEKSNFNQTSFPCQIVCQLDFIFFLSSPTIKMKRMNIPEEDNEISDLLIETYGPKKSRYLILYK